MTIDIKRFYQACDPKKALDIANPEDRKYYIDFSAVRDFQILDEIGNNIAEWSPETPTCQLFTGHIGCGKSTELLRLRSMLKEKGFYVLCFDSSRYLNIGDVDVSDILMAIIREIDERLGDRLPQAPSKGYFQAISDGIRKILPDVGLPIPDAGGVGIGLGAFLRLFRNLLRMAKDSPDFRSRLRDYLEQRTDKILDGINQELLEPVIQSLKQEEKKGLVVITDGLDRIERKIRTGKKTQAEYLFSDRSQELKQLNCHIIYTVPFELIFSKEIGHLENRFPNACHVLPMTPVRRRDGNELEDAMNLMRQMVMTRAFPDDDKEQLENRIPEIFGDQETLNRLCRVSGGHPRNLMRLVQGCITRRRTLPLSAQVVEDVIRKERNKSARAVSGEEWALLHEVKKNKDIYDYEKYHELLRNHFVLEYQDEEGSWFDVNPVLADVKELSV